VRYFGILFALVLLVSACGEKKNPHGEMPVRATAAELADEITRLEALQKDSADNKTIASELMRKYQDFYNFYPDDQRSANYLFRAADVARGMKKSKVCIDLLTTLHDAFPSNPKRDQIAFLVAFEYEQGLRDTVSAKTHYQKVIELYPESHWAREAETNLTLLEMTEAEMLEFLETGKRPA
jgi:tetratricopeptide (TPR) repeat protein